MYHHAKGDYHVAASEAARKGREKMEAIIATGKASAQQVLEQVESQVPKDYVSKAHALTVLPQEDRFALSFKSLSTPVLLHENAFRQVAEKAGIPNKYIDDLRGAPAKKDGEIEDPWQAELIAYNMNTLLQHSESRHLVRIVEENAKAEVRGFLSDRFRRLDSRPLLNAFMRACIDIGAVPMDGYALDTRVRMRAVLPMVFEPVPNEVMLWGVQWGNSDFGHGGHTVSLFNVRVWCTNTAIMDEVMRQVHLGKRLEDNVAYSNKTYELDNKANASALTDIIHDCLAPDKVHSYLESIKAAVEDKIDEKDVTRILKTKLSKNDLEGVKDLFDGPDVVNLPRGHSVYRLSNAVSFFAQSEKISRNKRLDLERIAGELLDIGVDEIVSV